MDKSFKYVLLDVDWVLAHSATRDGIRAAKKLWKPSLPNVRAYQIELASQATKEVR